MIGEIKYGRRVDSVSHIPGFEVEVRSGASSGASAETDRIAGLYHLVRLHEMLVEVSVYRFEAVGVAYDNVIAVSACLIISETYFAIESGADCVVHLDAYVDTFVHSSESGTVSVIGGDASEVRDDVVSDIYNRAVGDGGRIERIDTF